jgi:hypothetical protein
MGVLAGWFASAGASLGPPLPPPPTLPSLPRLPDLPPPPRIPPPRIPPPQVPQPPPVPPQAPRVPKVPPPAPRVPVLPPSLPLSGGGGGEGQSMLPLGRGGDGGGASSSGTSTAGARGQTSARHSGSSRTRVFRLHFSRNWISRTGPRRSRQTMLVFRLGRAAPVEFVVYQVAPGCRRIGRFRVDGHPGVNRVRFRGRVGRRVLGAGTYWIKARTLPRGRALVNAKLVVVARRDRQGIVSAWSADACGSKHDGQSTSTGASSLGKPAGGTMSPAGVKTERSERPSPARDVLGAGFARDAVNDVKELPLLLFILIGIAGAGLLIGVSVVNAVR